jgi:hypothetical protein
LDTDRGCRGAQLARSLDREVRARHSLRMSKLDVLDVRPGEGIGPVDIGMTREQVQAAAAAAGLHVRDFSRTGKGSSDLVVNGQVFVYFDKGGKVYEAEVTVPSEEDDLLLPVTCLDLDLTASYEDILGRVAPVARVDEADPEYPAASPFPELGLVLWADVKPEELAEARVESILVRRRRPFLSG